MDEIEKKTAPDAATDQKLQAELEDLRVTFQREWDLARADLPDEPVIQSLEEIPEEDDEDEEDERPVEKATPAEPKKKRREKKKHSKALLAIPIMLFTLVFLFFAYYFVMTMRYPEFSRFLSAFTGATFAADDEERLAKYEEALALDDEIDMFRQSISDNALVLTAKTKGMDAAKEFLAAHYDDALLQNAGREAGAVAAWNGDRTDLPEKTRTLLDQWTEKNAAAVDAAFDAVVRDRETADAPETSAETTVPETSAETTASGADAETTEASTALSPESSESLLETLGVPDVFRKDMSDALEKIRQGLDAEADGSEARFAAAVQAYAAADRIFASVLGHRSQTLLEHMTVLLVDRNAYAAAIDLLQNEFTDEDRPNPVGDEFAAAKDKIDRLLALALEPTAIARAHAADEDLSLTALAKTLPTDLPEALRAEAAAVLWDVILADREREAKNLTLALTNEVSALTGAEGLGFFDLRTLAAETFSLSVTLGYFDNADLIVSRYLKDEAENPSAHLSDGKVVRAFIREYEEYQKLENALKTCNDAFAAAVDEDGGVESAAALQALDDLLAGTDDPYLVGFANYYKCVALNHATDGDMTDAERESAMLGYMEAWAAAMPDHSLLWGRQLGELYRVTGNLGSCYKNAEALLALNVGDDYGNAVLALRERARGRLDAALQLALSGVDLSGVELDSAKEAAICYLLKGEHENAADMMEKVLANNLTGETLGLTKLAAALYDGDDEAFAETADEIVSECDAAVSQYGLTYPADVDEILKGNKTLAGVFLGGNYFLN